MLLRIELDARTWIADVGFGGQVLTAPLLLEPDLIQQTPHEPYRLSTEGDGYTLECQLGERWHPLYHFDLREQLLPGLRDGKLVCLRRTPNRVSPRISPSPALSPPAAVMSCTTTASRSTICTKAHSAQPLSSTGQMKELLRDCFRIRLPEHPYLEKVLARFLPVTP